MLRRMPGRGESRRALRRAGSGAAWACRARFLLQARRHRHYGAEIDRKASQGLLRIIPNSRRASASWSGRRLQDEPAGISRRARRSSANFRRPYLFADILHGDRQTDRDDLVPECVRHDQEVMVAVRRGGRTPALEGRVFGAVPSTWYDIEYLLRSMRPVNRPEDEAPDGDPPAPRRGVEGSSPACAQPNTL